VYIMYNTYNPECEDWQWSNWVLTDFSTLYKCGVSFKAYNHQSEEILCSWFAFFSLLNTGNAAETQTDGPYVVPAHTFYEAVAQKNNNKTKTICQLD